MRTALANGIIARSNVEDVFTGFLDLIYNDVQPDAGGNIAVDAGPFGGSVFDPDLPLIPPEFLGIAANSTTGQAPLASISM